ncbi:MAG: hypothetical protein KatS3mg110_2265 [Pirellulaceae bacterium]|nr:MAG: hypothetical protein KatS3mg110_2265 [Pirellulaceae bacterium]
MKLTAYSQWTNTRRLTCRAADPRRCVEPDRSAETVPPSGGRIVAGRSDSPPAGTIGWPRTPVAKGPRARVCILVPCLLLWAAACGCRCPACLPGLPAPGQAPPEPALWDNPMFVPAMDIDFLWDQVVDAVDDYFKIAREERLRLIGNVLTEGRLETHPAIGATYLEPWKRDSTPGFERWQSTFQTIRRTATVRVTPTKGGYLIDVQVIKELEDLYQPEHSTIGGATLRHDGSLVRTDLQSPRGPAVLGWIPLGRDLLLEQRLLADLHARLVGTGPLSNPDPGTDSSHP